MTSTDPELDNPPFNWTTRKIILAVLVVLSIILGFVFIFQFRNVVILFLTGVTIGISMVPAVEWLHRRKIPRSICVIFIYTIPLLLLLSFIILIIPQIIQQASALIPALGKAYTEIQNALHSSPYPFFRTLAANLPQADSLISSFNLSSSPGGLLGPISWTLNAMQGIFNGFFTLFVILLIGFYWTLEGERALYGILLLLPVEKRIRARETITEIETRVGGFVRGEGLLALSIGALAALAYLVIGLPSVLPLAFLAGIFELIPFFGPVLAAIPAVLTAVANDPSKVIWVIVAVILIQLLENHIIVPRIMHKTVGVNPIVTILAFVSFGSLFGFPGLLLSIPLAATVQVLLDHSLLHPNGSPIDVPNGRDRTSKLSYEARELVQDVRKRVRHKQVGDVNPGRDEVEEAVESIAADLDSFLAQNHKMDGPA